MAGSINIVKQYSIPAVLLAGFVFFLPDFQQLSILCIVGMLGWQLSGHGIKSSCELFKKDFVMWPLVLFYLVHVVGLFYTENWKYASLDLQIKASFLIFPILLTSLLLNPVYKRNVKSAFVAGTLLAASVCFIAASLQFVYDGSPAHFFYIPYSRFLHVTYFSMYLNLAVLFLLADLIKGTKDSIIFNTRLSWIILAFLFLNIILISARTALVTGYLTVFLFLFIHRTEVLGQKKLLKNLFVLLVFLAGAQILALHFSNRFSQVQEVIHEQEIHHANSEVATGESIIKDNSTSIRMHTWKTAWEIWKEHPVLGVGTGDLKETLAVHYQKINFTYGIKDRTSPHNQILHTGVILGAMGVFSLLLIFLLPLSRALKKDNSIFLCFLVLLFLNGLTESLFEVQKGVLFISFFYIFLIPHSSISRFTGVASKKNP